MLGGIQVTSRTGFSWDFMRGFFFNKEKEDSQRRGTFYRVQEPRQGFIDARDTLRRVPIITSLGGLEDRHEQQLIAELEHLTTNHENGRSER